jgi:choline dehydrogenase-like flavoprotein
MTYDLITIGGGLADSAIGKVMAERGARVLILERHTQFTDRGRGELMFPWGVAEAHSLGLYQPAASDGLQRPLVPRSRFQPCLSRSVRRL